VSEQTALVVGGTGPTGPHVVNGLLDRGYGVAILHTGRHESPDVPDQVEHIHTDPFDMEAVGAALADRSFELGVVMYGRLRELAVLLRGRVGKFISVGGVPAYTGWGDADALWPPGMRVPTRENARLVADEGPDFRANRKVRFIGQSEQVVFENHPTASHLRYPWIYGPGQVGPREWKIVRRILDGRRHLVLPDGGLTVQGCAYGPNAARLLLATLDGGTASEGQAYNVADEWTPTLRQWVEILAGALDAELEIVSIPWEHAGLAHHLTLRGTPHHRVTSCEKALFELGHPELVDPVEALADTARWLVANQPERGGDLERSIGDRFDYDGEDRLIAAWTSAMAAVRPVSESVDPHFVDRYAASFDERPGAGKGWTSVRR
jgi:nucleoside-diphosphate-sugar epimerase